MSWDIHIQDFPEGVTDVADISDDFVPRPIGIRVELIASIQRIFPEADFSNPSWGILEGDGHSIEFSMGRDDECRCIMLHVRGGGDAVASVGAVLDHLDLRGIDCQTGDFFSLAKARLSFRRWQEYRDRVISNATTPSSEKSDAPPP